MNGARSLGKVADFVATSTLFDKMGNVFLLVLNLYRLVLVKRIVISIWALRDTGRSQGMGVSRASSWMRKS
jgi:hypothetical protein